ncbi:MAG: hypothetical protein U0Q12_03420 [Vicinamibacterales bacterium]
MLPFLFGTVWTPLFANPRFGVLPLVVGTVVVATIAMLVAIPLGLLSAIYLSEYASAPARRVVKPALGIWPAFRRWCTSFALLFVTPLLQVAVPSLSGFNALGQPRHGVDDHQRWCHRSAETPCKKASPGVCVKAPTPWARHACRPPFWSSCPPRSRASPRRRSSPSRAVGETMIVAIAAGQQPRLA